MTESSKQNIELILNDVKKFKYVRPNIEKNKWQGPLYQTTRKLYIRINEARETFILLIEKNKIHEAAVIAGYIFEALCIFSFIKDSKNPEYNSRRYYASSLISEIQETLRLQNIIIGESLNNYKARLELLIKHLKDNGIIIVKPNKKKEIQKTPEEIDTEHRKTIETLLDNKKSIPYKIDLLEQFYKPISPKEYVSFFINKYGELYPNKSLTSDIINNLYLAYCKTKHLNNFSCENNDVLYLQQAQSIITVGVVFEYLEKYGFNKAK